jgi:hypothetical protein
MRSEWLAVLSVDKLSESSGVGFLVHLGRPGHTPLDRDRRIARLVVSRTCSLGGCFVDSSAPELQAPFHRRER